MSFRGSCQRVAVAMVLVTLSTFSGQQSLAASDAPSVSKTIGVMQGFMAAYNRHDLTATMAFFQRPFRGSDDFLDCDYAFLTPVALETFDQVKAWIKSRFAEGDRFDAIQTQANPSDPVVGSVRGTRTSDVLTAIGAAPFVDPVSAKVAVDRQHGQFIEFMWLPGFDGCQGNYSSGPLLRFPSGASESRTRGVAQAFIDAYNNHDVARVLQLVTKRVAYRGCDWIHDRRVGRIGKAQLKSWLRVLFADGDRYDQSTVSTTNPDQPNAARIEGRRTSRAVLQRNGSPLATGMDVMLPGPGYDRIGSLSTGRCPS
jgi:hypothetical protein